ncbi:MAG: hypothetical protein KBT32_05945 [Bacteroidales bacterium]|nr:hypothetical protein [Candidatus Physcocola equi]
MRFSLWGNEHLVSDALQTKHSKVFKESDLKDIEDIVSRATYVDEADVEGFHSHNTTKFYYFSTDLHEKTIFVNVGEVREKDNKGKTKIRRNVYSITDKLFHKK